MELLEEVNGQILKAGFQIKGGSIVDASLVRSSRRPRKVITQEKIEVDRSESEAEAESVFSYSDDKEANFVKKGKEVVYGYKVHAGVDQEHGFILGGVVTKASRNDGKVFCDVLDRIGDFVGGRVMADKGYPYPENQAKLKDIGVKDGIMQKARKGKPLSLRQKLRNKLISKVRYKVERGFGTLKKDYGFSRTRYLSCLKTENLFYLNAMAFNLKKVTGMLYC